MVGDKGADITKLGIMFGNSHHPNSANNFSIIGIYVGNDDHESLEQHLKPVFKQIEEIKFLELIKQNETIKYPIKW